MPQEVMSPDLTNKLNLHRLELDKWRADQRSMKRVWLSCAVLAAPLWIASYLMSAEQGPVNQSTWFSAATLFTFVGALGLTIAAVAIALMRTAIYEPQRNFVIEKSVEE